MSEIKPLTGVDLAVDAASRRAAFDVALENLANCIASGRLKVDAAGVTLTVDMIDVDVEAITGSGAAAKTLADIVAIFAGTSSANEPGKGVAVGATSTIVLAANASRKGASFVNDSDEAIYLTKGPSATMNAGERLEPNGGRYEINLINGRYTGVVTAICTSGTKNLCVAEV